MKICQLVDYMVVRMDILRKLIQVKGTKEIQLLDYMIEKKIFSPHKALTQAEMANLIGYQSNNLRKMLRKFYKLGILTVTKKGLDDAWYIPKIEHQLKSNPEVRQINGFRSLEVVNDEKNNQSQSN